MEFVNNSFLSQPIDYLFTSLIRRSVSLSVTSLCRYVTHPSKIPLR